MRHPRLTSTAMAALFVLPLVAGCTERRADPVAFQFDPRLQIVPRAVAIVVGDSLQFGAFFEDNRGIPIPFPPGRVLAWESSDPSVAQVTDRGRLTAVRRGQARITACWGRFRATALVWVSAGVHGTG